MTLDEQLDQLLENFGEGYRQENGDEGYKDQERKYSNGLLRHHHIALIKQTVAKELGL